MGERASLVERNDKESNELFNCLFSAGFSKDNIVRKSIFTADIIGQETSNTNDLAWSIDNDPGPTAANRAYTNTKWYSKVCIPPADRIIMENILYVL